MREKLKANLKTGLIAGICISVFGYILFEARFLIEGPELLILTPKNNSTVHNSLLEIKGKVRNLSSMAINNRQIMITPDGSFNDKLLLAEGYNTIEAKVKNKFGQESSEILEIVLSPKR